jgi:uncharacterized protein (DUF1684 family)
MKKLIILTMLVATAINASTWQQDLEQWKTERVTGLTQAHGWLSLIGMEWFKKGKNSIGSADDNDIVLPHGLAHIGTFNYDGKKITFSAEEGANIKVNEKSFTGTLKVNMDSSGEPSVFTTDSYLFYVIERGKPALRIKDSSAETLTHFKGLEYFPATEDFRVEAQFNAYQPAKEIEIINVLGLLSKELAVGYLSFNIDNKDFRLDVLDAEDDYYIIFADKTSGRSTYGPGRFLYVPKATAAQKLVIDFNKAYNPPCAFTDYSTCPLPPPQNRIPVYIEAGEKKYKRL